MRTSWQIYAIVLVAAYAFGIVQAQSQVAPVPSFSALIAGDYSSSTYAYVDVAGYYNSGDSGGGGAYQGTTTCALNTTAATISNDSTTITVASTAGIVTGMSIYAEVSSSNPIPPGDTIIGVNTTTKVITLADATVNPETTTTTLVLGGNGGTIFMDYQPSTTSPTCFYRQNYNADVRQFGARCDVVYSATDGSLSHTSPTEFTSSLVTFTQADVGKTLQLVYAQGVPPFRTTIQSVPGGSTSNTVYLANAAPASFPNDSKATDANMNFPPDGNDTAGAGFSPGQTGTAPACGTGCTPAEVQVKETGLVAFATPTSFGSGYLPNDILYGTGTGTGSNQVEPAQLQVLTVGSGGAVATYAIIYMGLWKGTNDPTAVTWQGGHGTGFQTNLLSSNASFGVAAVTLYAPGDYKGAAIPTNPVTMQPVGGGSGWTADLTFSTADWSYGTEDTVALQNIENYAETYPALPLQNTVQYAGPTLPSMRGLAGKVNVPSGMCYASGVLVSRPVSWSGAGPSNSRLVQLLGSTGISVNGSPTGFFTLPIAYPPGDDYQQAGYGQPLPQFENLAFWGSSPQTIVDVGSATQQLNSSSGIVLVDPVSDQGKAVALVLSNVDIEGFPNADLSAQHWGGVLRGYQVTLQHAGGTQSATFSLGWAASQTVFNLTSTAGLFPGMSVYPGASTVAGIPDGETIYQVNSSTEITLTIPTTATQTGTANLNFVSGNCLDLEYVGNPSHFYGLVTSSCNIGINIVRGTGYDFFGSVNFSNDINLSVTGALRPGATLTFHSGDFNNAKYENIYLDQQNETVICYKCHVANANGSGFPDGTDQDADIVLGPDAGSGAAGSLYPALELSAALFGSSGADENILFAENPATSTYCTCRVTLDGLSIDHEDKGGGVPNIYPLSLASQVFSANLYAPLQFATGTGTAVAASAPANANFGSTTFGEPSRLFSYVTGPNPKTFTATPPGGSGTWNVSFAYDVWDIERSGPTTAFTDTWDKASNIIAAIDNGGTYVAAGQRYSVVVCNSSTATETFAAGTGDTLAGISSLAPAQCGRFALLVTATGSSSAITIVGG